MKKQLLILVMLVLLLSVPMVSASATLRASLLRYEPLPAAPGQFVTAYVKLDNIGNEDATDVAIRHVDQFPFSIAREEERTDIIGKLQSQQSVVIDFQVRINSEAFIGTNDMIFEFTEDTSTNEWQEAKFDINIESDEAALTITKVESDEILPGRDGTVSITVKNNEETVLRNIALQLELETTVGTTTTDLPFIPINSATEKRISRLNPGEVNTVTYEIKAYPSATPGFYKLPLEISYVNDQGTETTNEDQVGVVVKAVPELKILLEQSTITKESMSGDITLQYINKGINDLKFLDSEVLKGNGYTVTSSSQHYIGDLDSDDFRSETYTVELTQEDVSFDVAITFKDENNEEYEQVIRVPVRFTQAQESNGNISIIIIVLIVVVAAVLIIRRQRKRRK